MKTMALNDGEDVGALFDRGSFGLNPDQATAELARITVEFNAAPAPAVDPLPTPADRTKAAEARLRLEALKADPETGRKYLSGDVATRQQIDELTAAIVAGGGGEADLALLGVHPDGHIDSGTGASLRDQIAAVAPLREQGIPGDVIRQVLTDAPVSRFEYTAVEQLRRERLNTPEWSAKLMAGDFQTQREATLMSIVLSSRVLEEN
jgi:hypothetical protein